MLRPRHLLITLFALALSVMDAAAQSTVADVLNAPGLNLRDPQQRANAVMAIRALSDARRQAARTRALQLGLPLRIEQPNGRVVEVADFIGNRPVYLTTHNVNAAISTGANLLQAAPYNMNGTGFTVGEWDAGSARSTHQEFGGRITVMDGAAAADHSTHVGGTIAAAGVVAAAKGMAPSIHIDSYEWTNDKTEMTSRGASYPGEAGKISLSNHSYGLIEGWNYTGLTSPKWTWYGSGTTSTGLETDFGRYDTNARDTDSLAFSLPYYLVVRSAGNERLDNPATGDPVSLTTSTTSAVSYDPASHPPGDGTYRSGYDTISADALAKNILTVGSVADAVSGGLRQPSNATMSSYSSWGPTDDGRIKPDVVANGEGLYSCIATSDTAYATYSGTSMASPNAMGSAALIVQWWDHLFPGHAVRASTLKALLIHTADDLGTPGPDYQNGWGLVNVKAAADLMQDVKTNPGGHRIIEDTVTTSITTRSYTFTWDGVSPIRATLCWTDPAGTATSTSDLRTARLVNDLDLKVTGPTGTQHLPFVMPFVGNWTTATFSSAATTGVNHTDNVEQVLVPTPPAAGTYTAVVSYTGSLTNGTQTFSLIFSGGVSNVSAPAPTSSSVTPATSTSGPMTLTLSGIGFLPGANIKFTHAGSADVSAYGQEITPQSIKFRVDTSNMTPGLWSVILTNPDGQTATLTDSFTVVGSLWTDNLEGSTSGWTQSALIGSALWTLTTAQSHTATHSFFANGPSSKNDNVLIAPAVAIPAGSSGLRLTFWHRYVFQSAKDGGVLEFSLDNGSTWFDVTATGSGAAFATGGYSSTISTSTSPINGRKAWSGTLNTFTQVAVDLTDSAKYGGKNLLIRWRLATNTGTSSSGWYVDDISVAGSAPAANLPPTVTSNASASAATVVGNSVDLSVMGSDDAGESALTYTWSALGGTVQRPVSFSENGTNAAKNTTATFSVAGAYTFTVTLRDADGLTATSSVDVNVVQTASGFTIAPTTVTLSQFTTQTFTASTLDQFTDALAVQPTVTWSSAGGGSVDSSGVYTASTLGGPFTVTASSAQFSADAQVMVTGETIGTWTTLNFSSQEVGNGSASDTADPDGDGFSNLAEYALGTDPHAKTSPLLPTLDSSGLTLTFTRPRGLPDVAYAAESSEDLINWKPLTIELVTDGTIQTMRARDDLTTGNPTRRFIRLKFTR